MIHFISLQEYKKTIHMFKSWEIKFRMSRPTSNPEEKIEGAPSSVSTARNACALFLKKKEHDASGSMVVLVYPFPARLPAGSVKSQVPAPTNHNHTRRSIRWSASQGTRAQFVILLATSHVTSRHVYRLCVACAQLDKQRRGGERR